MILRFIFSALVFCTIEIMVFAEGRIEIIHSPVDPLQNIEVFIQKPQRETRFFLLFLHGASNNKGVSSIGKTWYDHWSEKGYATAAVSMPGFGGSTGLKDFCGPLTIRSLNVAVDFIKREFDASDFGIIGFGQGATAGLLLAAQRNDIRFIVSTNGVYDLLTHLNPNDPISKVLIAKKYAIAIENEDFKIRSPIESIPYINAPIFVLHRDENPIVSPEEVIGFVEAMKKAGKECRLSILAKQEDSDIQKLTYDEIIQETETWIDAMMR
ncbi:MAG TPA: alpha/beta fold hydrolase [Chlamydiales bacterium]|nr:alpha/beta fold hydrolase [Chlamydiales bacterium]